MFFLAGVDEFLIFRPSIILHTITYGLEIDSENVCEICIQNCTALCIFILFLSIIELFIVSLRQMSEESQDKIHKDLILFRRDARKKFTFVNVA